MWNIIRAFVSVFVAFEMTVTGLFNGVMPRSVEMPEPETGEFGQYVDPFIGTGGTPWTCGMVSPAATVRNDANCFSIHTDIFYFYYNFFILLHKLNIP